MARPVPIEPRESVRTRLNEFDFWDVEEKLNHVRWALGGLRSSDHAGSPQGDVNGPLGSGRSTANTKRLPTDVTMPRPGRAVERAVWAMNKTATMLITCGVLLLAWSWLAARPDLPGTGWAMSSLGVLAWLAGWCTSLTCRLPLRSGGRVS